MNAVELEQIKKKLERYNEGQSTKEEQEVIEQWFENIHHRQDAPISEDELQLDLALIRQTLQSRIQTPARRRNMRPWYAIAAAITLLVTAGAWLYQARQKTSPGGSTQPVADNTIKTGRQLAGDYMIMTTAKGDTLHATLPDGSIVQLNAGSRLRYPLHFTGNRRDIFLEEGEAYFDVAQQSGNAFTVHTGRLTTTALGTTFNIRAYSREQKITVALLSGKVKVEDDTATTLVLSPSEQASLDLHSLQLVKTVFKANNPVSWQEKNLVFNDASYEEVRTEIENRFGVTLINQSDKQTWTYTGSFRQESLRNVIETICLIESLSYVIEKDTVLLKNK